MLTHNKPRSYTAKFLHEDSEYNIHIAYDALGDIWTASVVKLRGFWGKSSYKLHLLGGRGGLSGAIGTWDCLNSFHDGSQEVIAVVNATWKRYLAELILAAES